MMILTADIGNTNSVFGIWDQHNLVSSCRLSTDKNRTAFEWAQLLKGWAEFKDPHRLQAIYASVVPSVNTALEECFDLLQIKKCARLAHDMRFPFTFDYEQYPTLGADRLANAAAGVLYYGDNLIIVDFGTAITFCLITGKVYRGGVIAPGIHSSLDALFRHTAKLPEISFYPVKTVLGKSTVLSIEAGAYFGYKGLIREILGELKKTDEARAVRERDQKLLVVSTGGISESLDFSGEFFDIVDKNLTLRGLMGLADFI